MRIERLDLISYGPHRHRTLDFAGSEASLIVVVGPNEAGKSTAMRAIDALLFGFERGSSDHFGRGRESLHLGAILRSDGGDEQEVIRRGISRKALTTPDGDPLAETVIAALTGNTDRTFFRTMFRIDHAELTDNSERLLQADGEIGRLVFGASLGRSVALNDVLSALDDRAEELFKPSGRNPLLNKARKAFRDLSDAAREQRVRPREWDQLNEAFDAAERTIERTTTSHKDLLRKKEQLIRVRDALPHLVRRQAHLASIQRLEAAGIVATDAWCSDAIESLDHHDAAVRAARPLRPRIAGLTAEIEAISVATTLLDHQDRISELHQQVKHYEQARSDFPKRAAQTQLLEREVAELRAGLDHDATTAKLSKAQRVEISRLAVAEPTLKAILVAAVREFDNATSTLQLLRNQLDEHGDTADVSELSSATDESLDALGTEQHVTTTRPKVDALEKSIIATASRLGLHHDGRSIDEIAAITVPPRSRLQTERKERDAIASSHADATRRLAEGETKRRQLLSERDRRSRGVPDRSRVTDLREHRDRGWQLIKGTLAGEANDEEVRSWAAAADLPTSYEQAVSAADAAADARFDHAEASARLEEIARQLAELDADAATASQQATDAAAHTMQLDDNWATLWAFATTPPATVDEAIEWLDEHARLINDIDTFRTQEAELTRVDHESSSHAARLRALIALTGTTPFDGDLSTSITEAQRIIEDAADHARKRSELLQRIAQASEALRAREAACDEANRDLAEWDAEWATALTPLNLPSSTSPEAANATVQLLDEIDHQQSALSNEIQRRDAIKRLIDEFERDASAAATDLDPSLEGRHAIDIVTDLHQRLAEAQQALVRREGLEHQLSDTRDELRRLDETITAAETSIASLRRQVGADDELDLREVVERSAELARVRSDLAALEQSLIEGGGGRTIDQIVDEANSFEMDADRVVAELESLQTRSDSIEQQLHGEFDRRAEAKIALEKVDGSERAADLDEQAAIHQAAMAQHLDDYVRAKLASTLLRRVIAEYGNRHQEPILLEAGGIFAALTRDEFTGLVPDDDGGRQVLLARRHNDELLSTSSLSSGTRDQLYLAIRLAGIVHQLPRLDERLPLILDDLLVNFDNERSSAALEVLADLSSQTQVLLFTHEQHLADHAQQLLGAERCLVLDLPGPRAASASID